MMMIIIIIIIIIIWAVVAQSVQRLVTAWKVRGSNSGGGEIFRACPDQPWDPPSLLYNAYRVFPGSKVGPGRGVEHPHYLAPCLKNSRSITLLLLWVIMPCSRVTFTFTLSLIIIIIMRKFTYSSIQLYQLIQILTQNKLKNQARTKTRRSS